MVVIEKADRLNLRFQGDEKERLAQMASTMSLTRFNGVRITYRRHEEERQVEKQLCNRTLA